MGVPPPPCCSTRRLASAVLYVRSLAPAAALGLGAHHPSRPTTFFSGYPVAMSSHDGGSGLLFPTPEKPLDDAPRPDAPLADRIRPRTLEEILGQEEVLGTGKPLRRAIETDYLRSMILWGPPGSGKTTLAHVVRRRTRHHFEAMSAVLSGVKELREVLKDAEARRKREQRRTIVFID